MYGRTTSSASAAMTAEQMELRRARDKAAAEARAQARAAAAAAPTQHAGTHYSDNYTAGWERRLSAFDSDLGSVHASKPAKKEFPLAMKGWREHLAAAAIPAHDELTGSLSTAATPWSSGGGHVRDHRRVDIWKDVDVAEVCWTDFAESGEETEDTHR